VPVLVESFVVVGEKKDAEKPAQLWRFLPKAWNPYYEIRDPKTIRERAGKEVSMEEIFGEWTISADPERHAKSVQELFESGVTMVHIHTGQDDQRKVIEFYGEHVIPKLGKARSATASRA
jgi:alkanesulfonate monooxygenase SsuD/methylene tetrahydromethanopterin reductase-like flavin-dependent oxidoreductase (luciferase family)